MAKKTKEDLFANPFSLTHNDRCQLDDFFDDGIERSDIRGVSGGGDGLYEEVNGDDYHHDHGVAHHDGDHRRDNHVSNDVERVSNNNTYQDRGCGCDDDGYINGRPPRRRRGRGDVTLGRIAPNMFSTSDHCSINVVWMCVLISLLFFLGAYYGLSKEANERTREQQAPVMEGASKEVNIVRDAVPMEDMSMVDELEDAGVDDSNHIFSGIVQDGGEDGTVEEVGPTLTHEMAEKPKFTLDASQANFDPFQLLQHPPTKIKDANDWHGAPFVVSPPYLPTIAGDGHVQGIEGADVNSGNFNSPLGYLQYPTMANGTIVFSSEGDIFLTRLPDNLAKNSDVTPMSEPDIMTAMKLTTTVGNAIHPKLNPKNSHLLAYSATYSGVREVYLMDLRPCPVTAAQAGHRTSMPMGMPGSPGGPALRLTYTPGGIHAVVGWDEDGTSILYSAMAEDARALPDVRLFRLRLSFVVPSVSSAVGGEKIVQEEVAAESKSSKNNVNGRVVNKGSEIDKNPQVVTGKKQDKKAANQKKGRNKNGVVDPSLKKQKEWEDDDDDDGNDYTVAEAQNYVDKFAPQDKQAKLAREQGKNKVSGGQDHARNSEKATNKEGKDAHQRKLEKQERHRRHLAKLSAQRSHSGLGKQSSVRSIVEPVPLAQAREGVYHTLSDDKATECIYFTRFKQSSSTKRYLGGTAESLWAYCPDLFEDVAVPLTADYNGTSKTPSVYSYDTRGDVLLFMSDRAHIVQSELNNAVNVTEFAIEWAPSGMDLWAAPLPLSSSGALGTPIRLTNVACQFNGIDISEYTVDPATGGVILRIGADLHFLSSESIKDKLSPEGSAQTLSTRPLPIAVYSDFSNMQERLIPLKIPHKLSTFDAFATSYQTVSTLLTVRGQSFIAPVVENVEDEKEGYGGGGRNMPKRRYQVAPGTGGGGLTRVLAAKHIPQPAKISAQDSGERLALILATDPLSPTGEHAFYVIRTDAMAAPAFGFAALYEYAQSNVAGTGLPTPFLGGHLSGGSTKEGGLGSVYADTIAVSPGGRRFAFTDTDGRIVVVTIPTSPLTRIFTGIDKVVLPPENEMGQPLIGKDDTELVWSPGGRYLAIVHQARNQFQVISIADLGPPDDEKAIELGRIVQVTTDRFNSFSPVWGNASKNFVVELWSSLLDPAKVASNGSVGASALLYLTDRDVNLTGETSPWGTRAPSPSFDGESCVYVLPLQSKEDAIGLNAINGLVSAPYGGGGAMEVAMEGAQEFASLLKKLQTQSAPLSDINAEQPLPQNETEQTANDSDDSTDAATAQPFTIDAAISFGEEKEENFSFARSSYRLDRIPAGRYVEIVCQLADNPSLLLLTDVPERYALSLFTIGDWPDDSTEEISFPEGMQFLSDVGMSTDGNYIITVQNDKLKVTPRTAKDALAFFHDVQLEENIANVDGLHLSVWPTLEFQQMYKDAWRMLRDYFYDPAMHSLDWDAIFERYLPLVERCAKRDELDDVLKQLVGELSALHSFVYGGEYPSPYHGNDHLEAINDVATLGAILQRSTEKRGYIVVDIPERDPDFHIIDGEPMYSPLSNQVLKLSGQSGLQPGDVIVAVNHQNVMDVPDIHMLLRNTAGESMRLDVLRMESTSKFRKLREAKQQLLQADKDKAAEGVLPEPLIVVPMTSHQNGDLAYASWEWKTRKRAKSLAKAAGFSIGYVHLKDMSGAPSIDSFTRGFYPDYDKDALIIDVRNNRGGNIDSWLLDILQRTAWMYWESRSSNITTGGLGWDMQFAFRGHLVVLMNEHTSSDGEGFARGVSELGLGRLVGKRTWGGGIWLSSDNRLVDGGIATAPEQGTYNDNFGWGLGVEQMGVIPDVEVDNNPKTAFNGEDTQLERAITVLKEWLEEEPVALPKDPGQRKDMNKKEGVDDGCSA